MTYDDFMKMCSSLYGARGQSYGDVHAFCARVTQIYELMTGIHLRPREAMMFMHAMKLTRIFEDPANADHYQDGVNYLAFASLETEAEKRELAANVPEAPAKPTSVMPFTPPVMKPLNLGERIVSNAIGATDTGV